jgi:hypothetical protein
MIFQYTLRTESGLQVVDSNGDIVVYDRYSTADSARTLKNVLFVHGEPPSPERIRSGAFADVVAVNPNLRLIVATHGIDWTKTLQPVSGLHSLTETSESQSKQAKRHEPAPKLDAAPNPITSPLSARCPVCEAKAGAVCRSKTTGKPTAPHKARQQPRATTATRKAA